MYTILSYSILLYHTNGVTLIVNKTVENAVLGRNLKNNRMISAVPKANHSISEQSKSMPQLLMLKKLKLKSSMMNYTELQEGLTRMGQEAQKR